MDISSTALGWCLQQGDDHPGSSQVSRVVEIPQENPLLRAVVSPCHRRAKGDTEREHDLPSYFSLSSLSKEDRMHLSNGRGSIRMRISMVIASPAIHLHITESLQQPGDEGDRFYPVGGNHVHREVR